MSEFCQTDHLPWTMPDRPWSVRQDWLELAFLHWRIEATVLERLLPEGLQLDTFDGEAWIGIVPFRMSSVRFRWTPPFPPLSNFPEVNLRTYVVAEDKPGVYFLALDTPSSLAVWLGRNLYRLPYRKARQGLESSQDSLCFHSETRVEPHEGIRGRVQAEGPEFQAATGSLEYWLTERYCFYATGKDQGLLRCNVQHEPWPLQRGRSELEENSLLGSLPVADPLSPDRVHLSRGLRVIGWSNEAVGSHPPTE